MKKKVLFVCTYNQDRSPLAESMLKHSKRYEARSAGLSPNADTRITLTAVKWADIICVMDEELERHKTLLLKMFPEAKKKSIIVLDVPTDYCFDKFALENIIREKLREHFLVP